MKTMKFLPMLLITLAMSICMVSCSDDDDKDPANQDYAENKLFTKDVRMGLDVRRYQRNLNTTP